MTNKEKYYDELINNTLASIVTAVNKNTGKVIPCNTIECEQCKFENKGLLCRE